MENQTETEAINAVDRAIVAAGSQVKLAEALGVKQQAISIWRRRGWAPVARAQEIEAHYGIPRAQLLNPRLRDLVDIDVEAKA